MRKELRYECLFCNFFDECRRLEVNEIIIRAIQETGKCPDRYPIRINPSCRVPFFYCSSKYYVIGSEEPIELDKYYRVPSREVKEYVEKS
jgi:hypothetical protein